MKVRTNNWKKTILVGPGESVDLETVSVYQKPREEDKVEIKAVVMEGGKLKLKGMIRIEKEGVITSYSIHYTKLYEIGLSDGSIRVGWRKEISPESEVGLEAEMLRRRGGLRNNFV